MARPAGVTVIALFFFLITALFVLFEIRLFMQTDVIGVFSMVKNIFPLIVTEDILANLGAIFLLDMIVFPILYALAGWGLWKLRKWGRILTLGLVANGALFATIVWLLTPHAKMSRSVSTAISLAIDGVIIAYLLKADVKAAFSSFNPASPVHKPSVHFIP